MEIQKNIINELFKYKFTGTTEDLQINIIVSGDYQIKVFYHFSFDSINLRSERDIIEDLIEKFNESGWFLRPSYFEINIELKNCQHKKISEFVIFRKE